MHPGGDGLCRPESTHVVERLRALGGDTVCRTGHRHTRRAYARGSIIACCVVSLAAAVFGIFIYVDALFIHIGSTSALVFLFIPLYQLLAAAIVITFAIERRAHASRNI
jgi:hypothetical protein